MTYSVSDALVLKKIEDVLEMEGLVIDHPVTEENYDCFVAEYHLPNQEMSCCCIDAKGRCNQKHGHGFVVKVKDGYLSVIGHDCAKNKFSEKSNVRNDIITWKNNKAKRQKFNELYRYLDKKEKITVFLDEVSNFINSFVEWKDRMVADLGSEFLDMMKSRAKISKSVVLVEAVFVKMIGTKEQRQKTTHKVGMIRGIEIFDDSRVTEILEIAKKIRVALNSAESMVIAEKPNEKRLNELVAYLANYTFLEKTISDFKKDFYSYRKNDPMIFCYVCSSFSSRLKAVKKVLDAEGLPSSRQYQKNRISLMDKDLKEAVGGAKSIRIL